MFQIRINSTLFNTVPSIRAAEAEAAALISAGRTDVEIVWVPA